jgi:hypothetical protein
LLPSSPLRTTRASFPACRSSLSNAPCGTRLCHVERLAMDLPVTVGMQEYPVVCRIAATVGPPDGMMVMPSRKMFQTCGSATLSELGRAINAGEGSHDHPSAALPLLPRASTTTSQPHDPGNTAGSLQPLCRYISGTPCLYLVCLACLEHTGQVEPSVAASGFLRRGGYFMG